METALYYDIAVLDFYELTIREVEMTIKQKSKRIKDDRRDNATFLHTLAVLTGIAVSKYNPFSQGKGNIPNIEDVFPTLFDDDENNEETVELKEKPDPEVERVKDYLMRFSAQHNKKWATQNA